MDLYSIMDMTKKCKGDIAMKLYRVLALVLAMLMIGCIMVACDKEPEPVKTNLNLKICIKDGPKGDVIAQDPEFVYTYMRKGEELPTITEVLIYYCEINEINLEFQDDSQQVITKIDTVSPSSKSEFWTYALNQVNNLDLPMYQQTVKDGDVIVVYLDSLN